MINYFNSLVGTHGSCVRRPKHEIVMYIAVIYHLSLINNLCAFACDNYTVVRAIAPDYNTTDPDSSLPITHAKPQSIFQ